MAQCVLLWPVCSPGSFGYLSEWQLDASMDGLGVEAIVAVLKTKLLKLGHISAWFIGTHQRQNSCCEFELSLGFRVSLNLPLPQEKKEDQEEEEEKEEEKCF